MTTHKLPICERLAAIKAECSNPECYICEEIVKSGAVINDLFEALEKCKAALLSDPPSGPQKSIVGDDTIYHLDGALVGNALNAARAALNKASQ